MPDLLKRLLLAALPFLFLLLVAAPEMANAQPSRRRPHPGTPAPTLLRAARVLDHGGQPGALDGRWARSPAMAGRSRLACRSCC